MEEMIANSVTVLCNTEIRSVVILLSTTYSVFLQDTTRSVVMLLSTTDAVYFARHNIPIAIV